MKGSIIDAHPEGEFTFRACVLDVAVFGDGGVAGDTLLKIVNLDTGETTVIFDYECESPVIEDIFSLQPKKGE
jgi:hypothetical protein